MWTMELLLQHVAAVVSDLQ